jgi:hypothetical protein
MPIGVGAALALRPLWLLLLLVPRADAPPRLVVLAEPQVRAVAGQQPVPLVPAEASPVPVRSPMVLVRRVRGRLAVDRIRGVRARPAVAVGRPGRRTARGVATLRRRGRVVPALQTTRRAAVPVRDPERGPLLRLAPSVRAVLLVPARRRVRVPLGRVPRRAVLPLALVPLGRVRARVVPRRGRALPVRVHRTGVPRVPASRGLGVRGRARRDWARAALPAGRIASGWWVPKRPLGCPPGAIRAVRRRMARPIAGQHDRPIGRPGMCLPFDEPGRPMVGHRPALSRSRSRAAVRDGVLSPVAGCRTSIARTVLRLSAPNGVALATRAGARRRGGRRVIADPPPTAGCGRIGTDGLAPPQERVPMRSSCRLGRTSRVSATSSRARELVPRRLRGGR